MSETSNDPSIQAERVRRHAQNQIDSLNRRVEALSAGSDPVTAKILGQLAAAGRQGIAEIVRDTETMLGVDHMPIRVDPDSPPPSEGQAEGDRDY